MLYTIVTVASGRITYFLISSNFLRLLLGLLRYSSASSFEYDSMNYVSLNSSTRIKALVSIDSTYVDIRAANSMKPLSCMPILYFSRLLITLESRLLLMNVYANLVLRVSK